LEAVTLSIGNIFLFETCRKIKKALRLLRDKTFRHGLLKGVAAAIEHRAVVAAIDIETLVDVGANVGQFSLLIREVHPQAQVFAFEPLPNAAKKFSEVLPNSAQITLFQSAISARSGDAQMHVSRKTDSSSLLPITSVMTDIFPDTEEIGMALVSVGPLGKFISSKQLANPALLKIDVQGSELDVLEGCSGLLSYFKYIYVELSFMELYARQPLCHEVVRYLDKRNFTLSSVNNLAYTDSGIPVQADFLFVRADTCS
jgi:FkbM family methyltransferase